MLRSLVGSEMCIRDRTGTCLILVTPDSERTMCTFLGTAGKINENDVSSDAIKKSEIILLELSLIHI